MGLRNLWWEDGKSGEIMKIREGDRFVEGHFEEVMEIKSVDEDSLHVNFLVGGFDLAIPTDHLENAIDEGAFSRMKIELEEIAIE